MQKFAVIGLVISGSVSYACDVSMGRALFEDNWLIAAQYISLGLIGTVAMDTWRASYTLGPPGENGVPEKFHEKELHTVAA